MLGGVSFLGFEGSGSRVLRQAGVISRPLPKKEFCGFESLGS